MALQGKNSNLKRDVKRAREQRDTAIIQLGNLAGVSVTKAEREKSGLELQQKLNEARERARANYQTSYQRERQLKQQRQRTAIVTERAMEHVAMAEDRAARRVAIAKDHAKNAEERATNALRIAKGAANRTESASERDDTAQVRAAVAEDTLAARTALLARALNTTPENLSLASRHLSKRSSYSRSTRSA